MAKATKVQEKRGASEALFFCLLFLALPHFLLPSSYAATNSGAGRAPCATEGASSQDRLNDCNWIVTYRGRTYDLAPLTREALARPIESDIRYALQRVPEANDHLEKMSKRLKDARAHSVIASVFLAGVLATQLLKGGAPIDSDKRNTFSIISYGSGVFSLAGFVASWKATRDAKRELVGAVDSFNEKSAYKIEASTSGRSNLDMPLDNDLVNDPKAVSPANLEDNNTDAEKNRP